MVFRTSSDGKPMNVYEHADPDSLGERSHPWTERAADSTHRYYDFRKHPEKIRTSLEDWKEWSVWPAVETFYRLLEWLNGSTSVFESNDCEFSGAARDAREEGARSFQCSGRVMIFFRDLALNTSVEGIHRLTQAIAEELACVDTGFAEGAFGATIVPVRYRTLPVPAAQQHGQELMLSFWAWGDSERDAMTNLDRTLVNLTAALRAVADAAAEESA